MSGGVSGQYGLVKVSASSLKECTGWTMNDEVADHSYASCFTAGFKRHVAGTRDVTGDIKGVLDPDDSIRSVLYPGVSVELHLYYTANKYHKIPAVITKLDEEVDTEEGDIVRWTANYALNGTPEFGLTVNGVTTTTTT